MRVGLIAWDYPPHPSGLSTAALEIASGLAEAGADVRVFTLDRTESSRDGGIEIVGCRIAPTGTLSRLRGLAAVGHLAAPLAFRRAVLAAHRGRRFDILEATNWYAPGALLSGGPVPLVTRHSTPAAFSRDAPRTVRDRLDAAYADRLERRSAQRSAGHISNTAEHEARIVEAYALSDGAPRAVIGLSLPPETLRRGRAAAYPAEADELRLLFVGRAEVRKGFDALVAAAAILAAEVEAGALPAFRLVLVGVSPFDLPPGLPAMLLARTETLGRLPAAKLAGEYERAHAVLAPSRYESFGLVYQEAMAYGRPVLACAEDASARRFVGEPGAGLLATSATGPALAEALRPMLTDPALLARLRDNALLAAGRFDRASLGRETLALYERVLEARQSR